MNVAFIPVRGGSKSIPLKNIKPICGKPLVYWTIKAACSCKYIDKVYIATDSEVIKNTINKIKSSNEKALFIKAEVIGRSADTASDTASTESAMLEFAQNYEFDNIVLIQATSPLLCYKDLDKGFEVYSESSTDSVLSVVKQKRFNWNIDDNGLATSTNYDFFHRPRRQDFAGYFVENGAFYITSKNLLLNTKNRISGNIRAVEMNEDTFFEIDEPSDWLIIEALMKKNMSYSKMNLSNIKLFLTDCDGCLTDGGMYYSEFGDELKKFNTRDGMGFSLLRDKNIIIGIITSEDVKLNTRRAEKLKLNELISGCKDKLAAVLSLCKKYHCTLENVVYIGDDINDIELLKRVGFSCCPSDAMPQVKQVVNYISKYSGGQGVIRDVVEKLLHDGD